MIAQPESRLKLADARMVIGELVELLRPACERIEIAGTKWKFCAIIEGEINILPPECSYHSEGASHRSLIPMTSPILPSDVICVKCGASKPAADFKSPRNYYLFCSDCRKLDVTICQVDGCSNPVAKRGLCNTHYQRWMKHGNFDALPSRFPLVVGTWKLTDIDRAYIAAFMDGEGTIGVRRIRRIGQRADFSYEPYVEAGNTNPLIIEWLHEVFGGYYRKLYPKRFGNAKLEFYQWSIKCNIAIKFLAEISPFLRMKKAQADIILAKLSNRHSPGGRAPFNSEHWERMEAIYQQMKLLNKRGR